MPQEFQSYNPTQVGQGNNIVYQPVNQQYGQLYAQGLGRVANQRVKEAKAAQEKEYDFKGKFKGSSTYAPEVVSKASDYFQNMVTNTKDLTTNGQKRNEYSMIAGTMTNDAKSIADIEDIWNKVSDAANTDVSGNVSGILTNLAKNRTIDLAKKESEKAENPILGMRTYAGVMSSNQPGVVVRKSLQKEADRGDVFQKATWESSNLNTTNNPDFLRQSGGSKLSIRKDNYKALYNQYRNDDAIRNDYRHNDLMSADSPIKTYEDADNYIAEKFYNYGDEKKKIDKDKFAKDENYRKQVINESYANQEKSIDDRIDNTLRATLGIDKDGTKDTEIKNNMFVKPGAGSGSKKDVSVVESEKAGIFTTQDGLHHDARSGVTVAFTNARPIEYNSASFTNGSVYSSDSQLIESGQVKIVPENISKTHVIQYGTAKGDVTPLMIYTKDNKPFDGNYDDIKNNLGNYKIVRPDYLMETVKAGMKQGKGLDQIPDIDKIPNLISAKELETNPKFKVKDGIALHFGTVDKAKVEGEGGANVITAQDIKSGNVLLLNKEDANNNLLYKQFLKEGKGGIDKNGNGFIPGMTKFNTYGQKSTKKGAFGNYKGTSKK